MSMFDIPIREAVLLFDTGLEGAVLKDAESPYVRTRSAAWMKVGRPWQNKIRWRQAA